MAHTELGLRERRTIEDMLNAKMSVESIAAEIGRHRQLSTVRSNGTNRRPLFIPG
jgi:IS30 family transposase